MCVHTEAPLSIPLVVHLFVYNCFPAKVLFRFFSIFDPSFTLTVSLVIAHVNLNVPLFSFYSLGQKLL